MFKKFKDRLAEVGEEVKKDPRFVNSIASVNQLAQQVRIFVYKTLEKRHSKKTSQSLNIKAVVKICQKQM